MEMVKFTNGTQQFWVKNPKKIKYWRSLIDLPMSTVQELKVKQ